MRLHLKPLPGDVILFPLTARNDPEAVIRQLGNHQTAMEAIHGREMARCFFLEAAATVVARSALADGTSLTEAKADLIACFDQAIAEITASLLMPGNPVPA